jgi:exportin-1
VTDVSVTGPNATRTSLIRGMRSVKKETLKLIETFIEKSNDPQTVGQNFIPPLLETVLKDYKTNIADARDPEVLSVMAVIVNKLKVCAPSVTMY